MYVHNIVADSLTPSKCYANALQAPIAVSAWVFPAVQTRLLDKKDNVVDRRPESILTRGLLVSANKLHPGSGMRGSIRKNRRQFVLVLCMGALFTSMRNWSAEAGPSPIGGLHLFTKHAH